MDEISTSGGKWEDEEERRFFEDVQDLKDFVPKSVLGIDEDERDAGEDDAEKEKERIEREKEEVRKLEEELEKLNDEEPIAKSAINGMAADDSEDEE